MPERGCIVTVLAGKEAGTLMAVVRCEENRVLLTDGRRRPPENPKRKSIRHVADTGHRLSEHSMAANREIRRALSALREDAN